MRELATPALLAVLTPVIIGFGINYLALGAFLAAVILTGQLMATSSPTPAAPGTTPRSTSRRAIYGGKGSEAHKAAVIGDTVGDPFKDTAGPALNPLIKVMNLVSLLMLPADHQPQGQPAQVRHRRGGAGDPRRCDPLLQAGHRRAGAAGGGAGQGRCRLKSDPNLGFLPTATVDNRPELLEVGPSSAR